MPLYKILLPEIILVVAACVLFLSGIVLRGERAGPIAATIAIVGVAWAFLIAALQYRFMLEPTVAASDIFGGLRVTSFSLFLRMASLFIAGLLILLNWPGGRSGTGNASVNWGNDAGEFFGLLLLSFTGLILVANANDLILLFLAIELASIPTYVLVSVSRPLAQAQEAGVKYFFLGAMAAAILLMGFAYLYGVTGTTNLGDIGKVIASQPGGPAALSGWPLLAGVMLVLGLAFKLAAVPLHAYAADVYQGAATSVTAVLGFVPKTVGIVTLIKITFAFAGEGSDWSVAPQFAKLLFAVAIATMTVGNLLALLQQNVKRTLAYSSVAHSGYLIAGVALAVIAAPNQRAAAIAAVLFYLVVYGLTSTASFGALQLIPTRARLTTKRGEVAPPATTAETMNDLAGAARSSPLGAWVLALACLSLVGLPLTGGFWAKYYLLLPGLAGDSTQTTLHGWAIALTVAILVNSAISAAYYLGIVATLFARSEPSDAGPAERIESTGVTIGTVACAAIVLLLGLLPGVVGRIADQADFAAGSLGDAVVQPMPSAPAVAIR